jgi:hypothetical protein
MFESMEKTGHNHALPQTDRESYLQLSLQASVPRALTLRFSRRLAVPRNQQDKQIP